MAVPALLALMAVSASVPASVVASDVQPQPRVCPDGRSHEVVFAWSAGNVGVEWPNSSFQQRFEDVPRVPIGIEVFGPRVFLTLPRWYGNDFPLNVATVDKPGSECIDKPIRNTNLRAYPNWSMQSLDSCDAFQYVQNLRAEPAGFLWLPDIGKQFDKPSKCRPKIVIIDLKTDTVFKSHEFPPSVVALDNFLNDIALDVSDQNNKFAFISNSKEGAVVVYSLKQDKSWKAKHLSMKADNTAARIRFLNPPGERLVRDNHVNGITASPANAFASDGKRKLYYSPLTSFSLFEADLDAFKDEAIATNAKSLHSHVKEYKNKPSQGDGMAMDNRGVLYLTQIAINSVRWWKSDSGLDLPEGLYLLAQDNSTMIWADSVTMDEDGFLWFTTRGWPIDRSTNAVLRVFVGGKSYLHA